MALPAGVDGVTVSSGKPLVLPDGTPYQGKLSFAGPDVVTVGDEEVLLGGTIEVPLVDGEFSVTLAANDVAGMNPTGWTYQVTAVFSNAPGWVRHIALPKAAASVTLADVIVPDPVAGQFSTLADPSTLLSKAQNLADVVDAAQARANLGLGSAATKNVGATSATVAAGDAVPVHAVAPDPHGDRSYTDSQIAALSALTQIKAKTADESRTATTTVSDDLHLVASLDANSVYRFRSVLLFDGPETADATITFTVPAGATGGWSPVAGTLGTTVPDGSASVKMAARQFGSNSDVGVMASSATLAGLMVLPHGIVVTGATPGFLRLRWSQQTSNASPVFLKAGSTLEVVKVSGSGPSASGINVDYPGNYPSDQGLLAWTSDPLDAGHVTAQSSGSPAGSDVRGRITLTRVVLRKQITWSTISLGLSGVDAAATLSGCYLGVYDSTGTLRGSTADLSATFVNPANAKAIDLPLTTPFTAGPGQYFIGMLLNGSWQTNVFTFKATGAGISVNAKLAPPNLRYSNLLTGQTSLPASIDLTQQSTSLINTGWGSQWYGIS